MSRRTALCLGCRTALATEERCDLCGDAEIVDLLSEEGRATARQAAWRAESHREPRPWLVVLLAAVLGFGGLVALIALTIISVKRSWGIFPLEIIVGTVVWVASWALIVWIPSRFERTVSRRRPRGVAKDLQPPPIPSYTGTVACDHEVAAEAFEARHAGSLLFRDAHSHGFELSTDGTPIAIASGRVRTSLRTTDGVGFTPDWAAYGLSHGAAEEIVPHATTRRWLLRPGSRVRVFATLEDVLDDDASYRRHAAPARRAVGVVWLEPVG